MGAAETECRRGVQFTEEVPRCEYVRTQNTERSYKQPTLHDCRSQCKWVTSAFTLLRQALLCSGWEGCVGSSCFSPHSLHSKEDEIFLCSNKQHPPRAHSPQESPCPGLNSKLGCRTQENQSHVPLTNECERSDSKWAQEAEVELIKLKKQNRRTKAKMSKMLAKHSKGLVKS